MLWESRVADRLDVDEDGRMMVHQEAYTLLQLIALCRIGGGGVSCVILLSYGVFWKQFALSRGC